ncbi:DUF5455 family protein [Cupriavidus sp. NPDC089707]|uniref:DUF5455 family protein n=1 Tax=Cupriavidus sp. NPDC089707 TaxID=3363963 RepID=UPI0038106C5F
MPLLASLMAGLFGGFASFLVKFFSEKVAFGLAAVATFATLTTALIAGAATAINGVLSAFPAGLGAGLEVGLYLCAADTLNVCLAAIFATDAAVFLYRWNAQNVKLVMGG